MGEDDGGEDPAILVPTMLPLPTHSGLWAVLVIALVGSACLPALVQQPRRASPRFETTYEKLLLMAETGDPEVQNLLGFMFFHGEGVPKDFAEAHAWFHQAAEQGNPDAQRNLGLFHSEGAVDVPAQYADVREANMWFSLAAAGDPKQSDAVRTAASRYDPFAPVAREPTMERGELRMGEKVFITFCAGCHGFDGIAAYDAAPSFALGERLEQSDALLRSSVKSGKGSMPGWGETLSADLISYTLRFIRHRFGASASRVGEPPRQIAEHSDAPGMTGERIFLKNCAGCHGFNGIAYYVNSPSFALGERMEKSDVELMRSVEMGKGLMPSWDAMLSEEQIERAVAFIRTLEPSLRNGISGGLRGAPELYYRFRPLGETGSEWQDTDPIGKP